MWVAAPFAVILAAGAALAACGSSGSALPIRVPASSAAPPQAKAPAHVAVIMMENKEFSEVIGSRAAPYINGLARRYALARSMYAARHPSLPNYLALTGG
jgi:acid phosphatase